VANATHFYDQAIETLTREKLRELQNERLRALIARIASNQFYQEKARDAGLELSDIKSTEDLRTLPFTTKQELVADQLEHPPFGRLLIHPEWRVL